LVDARATKQVAGRCGARQVKRQMTECVGKLTRQAASPTWHTSSTDLRTCRIAASKNAQKEERVKKDLMPKKVQKLKLNRETLHSLEKQELEAVVGGLPTVGSICATGCQTRTCFC